MRKPLWVSRSWFILFLQHTSLFLSVWSVGYDRVAVTSFASFALHPQIV